MWPLSQWSGHNPQGSTVQAPGINPTLTRLGKQIQKPDAENGESRLEHDLHIFRGEFPAKMGTYQILRSSRRLDKDSSRVVNLPIQHSGQVA